MATKVTRIQRGADTQNGFALYDLEMFSRSGDSVGEIVLRAQIVNGQPDEAETADILRVLQREATRRGFPVAAE
jgi:hypothetical protein